MAEHRHRATRNCAIAFSSLLYCCCCSCSFICPLAAVLSAAVEREGERERLIGLHTCPGAAHAPWPEWPRWHTTERAVHQIKREWGSSIKSRLTHILAQANAVKFTQHKMRMTSVTSRQMKFIGDLLNSSGLSKSSGPVSRTLHLTWQRHHCKLGRRTARASTALLLNCAYHNSARTASNQIKANLLAHYDSQASNGNSKQITCTHPLYMHTHAHIY